MIALLVCLSCVLCAPALSLVCVPVCIVVNGLVGVIVLSLVCDCLEYCVIVCNVGDCIVGAPVLSLVRACIES